MSLAAAAELFNSTANLESSRKEYRARIIKQVAEEVFQAVGKNPLIDIATQLEQAALSDDYFVPRQLYTNVDFYSGLIYEAIGLLVEMFTVLFAVARTAGWAAHWLESEADPERRIARPRQICTGLRDLRYPQSA